MDTENKHLDKDKKGTASPPTFTPMLNYDITATEAAKYFKSGVADTTGGIWRFYETLSNSPYASDAVELTKAFQEYKGEIPGLPFVQVFPRSGFPPRDYCQLHVFVKMKNEEYAKPGKVAGTKVSDILMALPVLNVNVYIVEDQQGPFYVS
jgi:hypothetical protein